VGGLQVIERMPLKEIVGPQSLSLSFFFFLFAPQLTMKRVVWLCHVFLL
jgi:hypothetical protein